jgi:hypothetical protein
MPWFAYALEVVDSNSSSLVLCKPFAMFLPLVPIFQSARGPSRRAMRDKGTLLDSTLEPVKTMRPCLAYGTRVYNLHVGPSCLDVSYLRSMSTLGVVL